MSVRLSVTFVYSVETSKHVFKLCTSDSHGVLVFPHQTLCQYSDGDLHNGDVECRWGRQNGDSREIYGYRIDDAVVYGS